jgi:hypothetical protein
MLSYEIRTYVCYVDILEKKLRSESFSPNFALKEHHGRWTALRFLSKAKMSNVKMSKSEL